MSANKTEQDYLESFLLINGFKKVTLQDYENDKCTVSFSYDHYEVYDNINEGSWYSKDLNIYWLIGILTWNNLIDKNYNQ